MNTPAREFGQLPTITQELVTETSPHVFAVEASDLQLLGWPIFFETTLGNGQRFVRHSKKVDADGDIQHVRYRQANGCVDLIIFND